MAQQLTLDQIQTLAADDMQLVNAEILAQLNSEVPLSTSSVFILLVVAVNAFALSLLCLPHVR